MSEEIDYVALANQAALYAREHKTLPDSPPGLDEIQLQGYTEALATLMKEMALSLQKQMSYLAVKPNRAMRRGNKNQKRLVSGKRSRGF